jgi:hypothetical protein
MVMNEKVSQESDKKVEIEIIQEKEEMKDDGCQDILKELNMMYDKSSVS